MEEVPADEENVIEEKLVMSRPPELHQLYPYPHSYIWLLLGDGKDYERQTFYNILEDRYFVRLIPELQNKEISCNYQEWLVLADNVSNDCYLLNILTMEKIQLPPLDIGSKYRCVLCVPEKDSERMRVFFFEGHQYKTTSCYVGDTEFVGERFVFPDGGILLAAINFKGKVCALTMFYNLQIADPSGHDLDFTEVIEGVHLLQLLVATNDTRFYLVESSGELLFIFMRCYGVKVESFKIFKADINLKEWVRLDSIGDRAIFLDPLNGYSCPASADGMIKANSIYFSNWIGKNIYVYDIEDQSISLCLPCPIVGTYSTKFWISVPNHS